MTSVAPHRIINTRERGTSTDINRIIQLSDRNTALATWYAAANDETVSGVLTGLRVSISGDTVTVGPGLALLNDGVGAYPDSPYRWMEVAPGASALTIDVGTTKQSGEWMVIDIEPGVITTITTNVDVFDPTTGSFVSTSLPKEVQSRPVLSVRTSGNANQFPAGVSAKMPLAYIYDNGGSLSNAEVVHCRPLLRQKSPMDASDIFADSPTSHINDQLIQGGGIRVAADGTTVEAFAISGRFYGARSTFKVGRGVDFDLSDVNAWDGGALASSNESVYLYAVPPPYPTGYGALAKREFVVGTSVMSQFATVNTGATSSSQIGCIVVASTEPPDSFETGAQGPFLANIVVHDVPFRNGGGSVAVAGPSIVYMGAIDWATSQAMAQEFVPGDARVIPQTRVPRVSIIALGAAASFHAFDARVGTGTAGAGDGIFPPHAFSIRATLNVAASIASDYECNIRDSECQEIIAMTGTFSKDVWFSDTTPNVSIPMEITQLGATIEGQYQTDVTTFVYYGLSYVDSIIAAR